MLIGGYKTGVRKRTTQDLSKKDRPIGTGPKKPPKYRNVRVNVDGHTFDSKKEADVYRQLRAAEKAGAIRALELQPRFTFELDGQLLRNLPVPTKRGVRRGKVVEYRADFSFEEPVGKQWVRRVIDVKGYDTQLSRLKRAMVGLFHKIDVEIV